ncbi:histidinol dehydrogenase [Garciella nitratireducens]|uniref:Histidinol dehydrogenase n=1 Tax=Garciella nitratireducens DSM 15102 TaxID=1121911 RepID=A0A1T4KNM0_9FIRM|nr:histidinol dehydrogenase [Garciella nitratireducens]SJZ43947.1 histidinol dehydrogenase [Garciella nitratireducens DSM 15102]
MKIIEIKDNQFLQSFLNRNNYEEIEEIDEKVDKILAKVEKEGDQALLFFTEQFDHVSLQNIKVTEKEIEQALQEVEEDFLKVLQEAKENIWQFHQKQMQNSWFFNKEESITLGQKISPIERVGIYVPGGKAAYPSTVLMDAIPAKVAGVSSISMVTPPGKDGKIHPNILAAAKISGVDEIYKVGGAQAIAALTFGTESIKPVSKIVGPGNIFVARAKRKVFGYVDIDMIAGPSEICIIADEKAKQEFVAADLLSQAEHDELACSILITPSLEFAKSVKRQVEEQLKQLKRKEIAQKSIENYGAIIIVDSIEQAFTLSNEIAPEHLEILLENPFAYLSKVKNAGAIFLGSYSPEPLGDYFAGPNHTLPTSRTAKFSSPLGVDDFIKKSSIIYYKKNDLEKVKDKIIFFTEKEGLEGHGNSIKVRF